MANVDGQSSPKLHEVCKPFLGKAGEKRRTSSSTLLLSSSTSASCRPLKPTRSPSPPPAPVSPPFAALAAMSAAMADASCRSGLLVRDAVAASAAFFRRCDSYLTRL